MIFVINQLIQTNVFSWEAKLVCIFLGASNQCIAGEESIFTLT